MKKLISIAAFAAPIATLLVGISPVEASGCIKKQDYINGKLMYLCQFRSGVLKWVSDPYNECQKVCDYQ